MPSTWNGVKHLLGYDASPTYPNVRYVTYIRVKDMLSQGYSERQILWWYNSGRTTGCIKGTNKYGVNYDSCTYADKILARI